MYELIAKAAEKHGFAVAYFLKSMPLPRWAQRAAEQNTLCGMDYDIPAALPWARCMLLLVRAYSPYEGNCRILPYYIAENDAYFKCKSLCKELGASGRRFEPVWTPARALALENGVGVQGKNGLLSLPGLGSRISLFTVATDAVDPVDHFDAAAPVCPPGCRACIDACPTGAIRNDGLDARRCMRYHMNGALHPQEVLEKLSTYMGCDTCQRVCPKNSAIAPVNCPQDILRAFDTRRLITGDAADARALVGKNATGGGKLTAEAIAFAAKERLYEDEIRGALASPFEAVRTTAKWALGRYF